MHSLVFPHSMPIQRREKVQWSKKSMEKKVNREKVNGEKNGERKIHWHHLAVSNFSEIQIKNPAVNSAHQWHPMALALATFFKSTKYKIRSGWVYECFYASVGLWPLNIQDKMLLLLQRPLYKSFLKQNIYRKPELDSWRSILASMALALLATLLKEKRALRFLQTNSQIK